MGEEHIFPHQCVVPECEKVVQYDDEPWCFEHSPDEGSHLAGYSARRATEKKEEDAIQSNIFTKNQIEIIDCKFGE
jgi:hypothetical protein